MINDSDKNCYRLLTIVIPVFNTSKKFLSQTLNSVAAQSLDASFYDIIIVDDGSANLETCDFLDVLQQQNHYEGVALRLIRHAENRWLAQARITGAQATDAEFILFLDSDDYIANDYLKKAVLLLQSHHGATWVYPNVNVFGQHHEIRIAKAFQPFRFFLRNKTPYASVFRRADWLKVSQRDKKVNDSVRFFEDWDTTIRLMGKGLFGTPLRDSTLFYRKHTGSMLNRSTKVYLLSIYTTWHANLLKVPLLCVSYLRNRRFQKKFKGEAFFLSPTYLLDKLQQRLFQHALEEPRLKVVLDFKSLVLALFKPALFKQRFLDQEKMITLAEIRCGFLRKPSYDDLVKLPPKRQDSQSQNPDQKNIVFAHTWWTIGGAEQVLLEWIKTASKQLSTYKVLDLCQLDSDDNDSGVKQHFAEYVDEQYCLQNIGSTPYERLAYCWNLICQDKPQMICISGNAFLYALSPLIKKHFPDIVLIDILHNEWDNHFDWFNVAAEYQASIDYRLVISEYWRDILIDKYQERPEKVHIVRNFIDTYVFNPQLYLDLDKSRILGFDTDAYIVTFIGRLHEQKDPEVFLKVAQRMQANSDYHFIMVGGGPLQAQVEDLCAGLRNVTFFGEKTNIADFLTVTDILLCTSKYEGYPLVSLEAAAMQVPVIAPNIVGFNEQIELGNFGMLYQVTGDAGLDATNIVTLLKKHSQEILRMGSNGPKFIAKYHHTESIRRQQGQFFDNTLALTVKPDDQPQCQKRKKKTLYLHVGIHKTGSSSIQHFLYHNRKRLNMSGLLYPSKHSSGYEHYYTSEFFDTEKQELPYFVEERYQTRENWESAIQAQRRELLQSSVDKCVLSSEDFWRCNYTAISNFYRDFDTKIIIFLRRQDVWLESMLNEYIKMYVNMKHGLTEYVRKIESRVDYYQLLSQWAELFGQENLIIVPFQKTSFPEGLEKKFLQLIDIPWNVRFQLQQAKNIRLNRDCIDYLADFPMTGSRRVRSPEFRRIIELLQKYSQMQPNKPEYQCIYSPEERLRFLEKYRESNQRVATEFLNLKSGELFDEPMPNLQEPWAPYPGIDESSRAAITQYLVNHDVRLHLNAEAV